MQTNKDVKSFLERLQESSSEPIVATFEECSKNRDGRALVNNRKQCYNFDKVVKTIFPDNSPSSVDCLYITSNAIEFIEFKGGLIDQHSEVYRDPGYSCPECSRLHRENYEMHEKIRKHKKTILHDSLRIKAADSLLVMQNCIFPDCEDTGTCYSLRYVCVYKNGEIDPTDEYELGMADLADKPTADTLNDSLRRYGQENRNHLHPFYDDILVLSNLEFQNRKRYQ